MKIKSLFLYAVVLFLFSSKVFAGAISSCIEIDLLVEDVKKENVSIPGISKDQLKAVDDMIDDLFLDQKSIHVSFDMKFDKTVFAYANYFYLGAETPSALPLLFGQYSLTRSQIIYNANLAKNVVEFLSLAPLYVFLNGETEDEKPVNKLNPIYNNGITNLKLKGSSPVLTLSEARNVADIDFFANQLICLVDDINQGSSVKTNMEKIKDANGDDISSVAGIAGSQGNIFAAVAPNVGVFGAVNSGFANLIIHENKFLKQVGDNSFKLDLDADQLIAITRAAQVGGFGDMYWDSRLGRLFIGLTDVKRVDPAEGGGVVSLLVGRIENNSLVVEPAVALNLNFFDLNSDDFIFGFYSNNVVDLKASVRKIRTMHTSTGYSYVIINASVENRNDVVYAIPLVPSNINIPSTNVGKIANKNSDNFEDVVADEAGMTKANDPGAFVGGLGLPMPSNGQIRDMFVVGDSVYISLDGARDDVDNEAGIFKSTALFQVDGKIRAWTEWQRVMGAAEKVYGAGLDTTTADFWYLTDQNNADQKNTVKVTQWGKSDEQSGLMGNGLVKLLEEEFKQENAGVHQMWNFDEKTPSFSIRKRFSMMVATGYQQVALIETGKHVDVGWVDAFTPTSEFIKDTNVFFFNDQALKDIGPICCSEVSKITSAVAANSGWLFVGGYQGVAVLRQGNGDGWNNLDQLSNAGFPGDASWSFKELKKDDESSFSQVRKIICDGTDNAKFLYVMNADSITRIKMETAKFTDVAVGNLNNENIAPPSGTLLDIILFYRNNGGHQTKLLVATTAGLFASNNINDDDDNIDPVWTAVNIRTGVDAVPLAGPVVNLNFMNNVKGGFTTNGNMYVLTADFALNLANIYRFDVKDGDINHIIEPDKTDYFYSIGQLRSDIFFDGSFGFNTLSKHLGKTEFLRKINVGTSQSSMRSSERSIGLDLEESAYNIGLIVRNTASGGWVVPGDWGIRVSE